MFPIEPGHDYAVITGDVVDSSGLTADERQRLPDVIREAHHALSELLGETVVSPIAVFGGDSWQLLLAEPATALRAALFMRASLLGSRLDIDTRAAIAVGGVDFVPQSGVEEADGEAFRLSGRMLRDMSDEQRSLGFAHPDPRRAGPWDTVCLLLGALIEAKWTAVRGREELAGASPRALAVIGALRGWTAARSGEELWPSPVSAQAVTDNLARAGWPVFDEVLCRYAGEWPDLRTSQ